MGLHEIVEPYLLLIPLIPLFGALSTYLLTAARAPVGESVAHVSGWLASSFSAFTFLFVALWIFPNLGADPNAALVYKAWNWFSVGGLSVDMGFRYDRLSAVMTFIITGVGTLIHIYAIGYMAEDPNRPRFFTYLNLFLFAMLLLVLGDNMLVMFVGWEGVGLCSYLLIGFWFKEMANAKAGQKAFIVNRIGDAGFLLGMFTLAVAVGSLDFSVVLAQGPQLSNSVLEWACALLFVGAIGKSAQIPLFIWLPDAMAGPTPVSALIHAATMVTAGVYMIARLGGLYTLVPDVGVVISVIGVLTAFVAATIAIVQTDIKKVLAYSTVSQLGYMFMAMGVAAYSNGIYHVVTHAFFKACLFMCAGSVIIGCHHEQDMRKFGGLWKKMPLTCICYLVATLAIAGFPFLSGFYSKDAILWTVFSAKGWNYHLPIGGAQIRVQDFIWALGLITAVLTAFYMTRSFMLTFTGRYRGDDDAHDSHAHDSHAHDSHAHHADHSHASDPIHGHGHPHGEIKESPAVIVVPLIFLAILSAGFGHFYGSDLVRYLSPWTRPDILAHLDHKSHGEAGGHAEYAPAHGAEHGAATAAPILQSNAPHGSDAHGAGVYGTGAKHEVAFAHGLDAGLMEIEAKQEHFLEILSMSLAVLSILAAFLCYLRYPSNFAEFISRRTIPGIHKFLVDKWRIDELYEAIVVKPLMLFSTILFRLFDRFIIDGTVNGAAAVVRAAGSGMKALQSGRVSSYAFLMFSGTIVLVAFWLVL